MLSRIITSKSKRRKTVPTASGPACWKLWATTTGISPRPRPWSCGFGCDDFFVGTVSCLPSFAQPYRVVNTSTVAAGFNQEDHRPQVQRWSALIEVYWRRFETHLPALLRVVGQAFGPVSLQPSARSFWRQLWQHCGDLAGVTTELIHQFHTCLFGTYRCHQRPKLQVK
jgi:hypothetical protein